MRGSHAGLVAVILAAGVAVALPAVAIIVALKGHATAADAELIGVLSTLAGTATGTVCGWLASVHQDAEPPSNGPEGGGGITIPRQRPPLPGSPAGPGSGQFRPLPPR